MASVFKQDQRLGKLETAHGDSLVLSRLIGQEAISELFEFVVEAVSEEEANIDFADTLGTTCTVTITTLYDEPRYFAGTLAEARRISDVGQGYTYELVLRPQLWLLGKQTQSRVFHEKSALDIIREVLSDHGLDDFELSVSGSLPKLEYCVQHRESDLNFLLRLLEANGIAFFYRFGDGAQHLVMTNIATSYQDAPRSSRRYVPAKAQQERGEERFSQWMPSRRFTSGKVARNDYDFRRPSAKLLVEKSGDTGRYAKGDLEHYDHPYHSAIGKEISDNYGEFYAQAALDAVMSEDRLSVGVGDCLSLGAGMQVTVTDAPAEGGSDKYLVVRATHDYTQNAYTSGAGQESTYVGSTEVLPVDQHFAPPRTTPRPSIPGVQTGTVVGEGEIDTDEFGRIQVRFPWMRDDGHSMWCRVAQSWAGDKWGTQFIPRIGMEVLVQFFDGDPDQPVVVGTLYNGDNSMPFDDPNRAGWRSQSTRGGDKDQANEIILDDTKGNETLTIHAQNDLKTEVERDETREVTKNRTTTIKVDDTLTVDGTLTIKVGQSKIVMDATSITITSPMIKIDASGSLQTKAGATAEHKADGPMMIKGAIVAIN